MNRDPDAQRALFTRFVHTGRLWCSAGDELAQATRTLAYSSRLQENRKTLFELADRITREVRAFRRVLHDEN
jgi:hypothetical protein